MGVGDLSNLTAAQAIVLMRLGTVSAEIYAGALLARVEKCRVLNALIAQDAPQVLADARRADRRQRQGRPLGPLHGLPVLIKDNINTTALPTTAGTPALAQNRPARDARIVSRLLAAGAILFGKSNMHELSYGITSNNCATGPVRNPYDLSLIAGGSSGGNAAALAARMVAATVGADTGGSIRIPAALCGIVGLRPTSGRYPGTGAGMVDFVPVSHTHDTPGPMARCVADVALLDSVMTGVADPWRRLARLRRRVNARHLRLGIARGHFFENLDPELERVVNRALRRLKSRGVTLIEIEIPRLDAYIKASRAVSVFETMMDLPFYLKANRTGITLPQLARRAANPDVRQALRYVLGRPTSAERYRNAVNVARPKLQQALHAALKGVDSLIFPTTPLPARPIGDDKTVLLNGARERTLPAYCSNTEPAASAGLPGLSFPAGLTSSGLPVGLEIDGMPGEDEKLLAIGFALERIFDPLPPPPIFK